MKRIKDLTIKDLKIDFTQQRQRFSLTFFLGVLVFVVLLFALGLAFLTVFLLVTLGVVGDGNQVFGTFLPVLLIMIGVSLVIGAVASLLLGKFPLRPINAVINGMNSLAAGNFKTRLKFRGAVGNHPAFIEVENSFNKLAEELEHTEVLRKDFINNFSHEVKTPIVSIAGFAKLLKRGRIDEEARVQYLTAIEEEAFRLSYMATNVLNMARVENQEILSDTAEYNLSEQIRSVVLLLEEKWSRKNLDLVLEFDEYTVRASEELLKQVWINLLDNAVKFTPEGGTVSLEILGDGKTVKVRVSNEGAPIPEDKRERIFNKFYQVDESHAGEGNGIGLAIVKRIVTLHGGEVRVECKDGRNTFEVELPL